MGIVLALLCGACASDEAAPARLGESTTAIETSVVSPLFERLGFSSDENARQRQWVSLQHGAEEAVAACMASQGFSYVPSIDQALLLPGFAGSDGSSAWAEQNGLGVTRSFQTARRALDGQSGGNPNADYLLTLTPDQADDYTRALLGDLPEAAGVPLAYEPGGCQGQAFASLSAQLVLHDEFASDLGAMNTRLAGDPRVRQHMIEWSTCMAVSGYDYLDQEAMTDDVFARLLEVDVFTDKSLALDSSTELEALLAFEQAVAIADFVCSRPFQADLTRIRGAYEQEFLEDHRERIDEALRRE